jgi:hypothetical protein
MGFRRQVIAALLALAVVMGMATSAGAITGKVTYAAGDIACSTGDHEWNGGRGSATNCAGLWVGNVIRNDAPFRVFALGDLQYDGGAIADFNSAYDKQWGDNTALPQFAGSNFYSITRPVAGNHEYNNTYDPTSTAEGFQDFWDPQSFWDRATHWDGACTNCGYYSFTIESGVANWLVIALNTNCAAAAVSCANEASWMAGVIAADGGAHNCILALGHHPRWTTQRKSEEGVNSGVVTLYNQMYDSGVDLYLVGHNHYYQRFAPLNKAGVLDGAAGVRQITVGTGGKSIDNPPNWVADDPSVSGVQPLPNAPVAASSVQFQDEGENFGALKLVLGATQYDADFRGGPITVNGSGVGTGMNVGVIDDAPAKDCH